MALGFGVVIAQPLAAHTPSAMQITAITKAPTITPMRKSGVRVMA